MKMTILRGFLVLVQVERLEASLQISTLTERLQGIHPFLKLYLNSSTSDKYFHEEEYWSWPDTCEESSKKKGLISSSSDASSPSPSLDLERSD